ncbi:hypothetical protein D3C86_2188640 [compost metagenome]
MQSRTEARSMRCSCEPANLRGMKPPVSKRGLPDAVKRIAEALILSAPISREPISGAPILEALTLLPRTSEEPI